MARILTLTTWFPPHHFGGYEVLCDDVMTRLHGRGHEVEVLCSNEELPSVRSTTDGAFPVHRRLRLYWQEGAPHTPDARTQLAIERANQRELSDALDRFAPDVVSVWHMGALSLSLLTTLARRRIPMVYAICDEWLIYGVALDPWSRRFNGNPFRRLSAHVAQRLTSTPALLPDLGATGCFCFLSEFTKRASQAASAWSYPVAPVVYPGIDRTSFPPPGSTPLGPWSGRLLYTGRLDARKGTDTLLRALPLLPPTTTLSLLGRGEAAEQARLEALAAELDVTHRVHFEGIARNQLADAYGSHDCLIFPSEWPEPFGMVPLEAMACGTPVVATGVGGSGEFLRDGSNCLLFHAGDAAALARAVTRLADDEPLRLHLRQRGWVSADQFDLGWTTTAYEECHLAAAEGRLGELDLPPHPSTADTPHAAGTPNPDPPTMQQPPAPSGELAEAATRVIAQFNAVKGAVLLFGCDGTPGIATGIGATGDRAVVAVEPSLQAARGTMAAPTGPSAAVVVAHPDHLPFLSSTFAGIVSHDTLERSPDDRAALAELARVAGRGGTVVFVAPNRLSAATVRRRASNWWKGWRRPLGVPDSRSGWRRQYDWHRMPTVLAPDFLVEQRWTIPWDGHGGLGLASQLLVGPLRAFCRGMVVKASPR